MSLIPIKPEDAQRYIAEGAVLIDIREDDEHARECIPGARHAPMSRFGPIDTGDATAVIFHCRTGGRTTAASEKLAQAVKVKAYVLEGGLDAWKKAGLPVVKDKSQPIELQRQVQIAAGSLVLIGIALGSLVAPAFYATFGLRRCWSRVRRCQRLLRHGKDLGLHALEPALAPAGNGLTHQRLLRPIAR